MTKSPYRVFNSRIAVIFLAALILNFTPGLKDACYAKDKIIAIVNSDVITQKDLDDFVHFMSIQLSREYSPQETEKKIASLKTDLLDKLIEDKLILQEAKKNDYKIEIKPGVGISIKPDESRVKARIAEIRKHYDSDAAFQEELSRQGIVQADLEQKIREQILMYNIIEYRVRNKVAVKPDEVTEFYDKNMRQFVSAQEREVDCYVLENKDLALSFALELGSGKAQEDLATRFPFNVNRMNVKQGGELKMAIEEAVFKLNINEVSQPQEAEGKYYVFKLLNIIPPKQLTLSEVQDRIHSFLYDFKMKEKLTQWLQDLRGKSYIKIAND